MTEQEKNGGPQPVPAAANGNGNGNGNGAAKNNRTRNLLLAGAGIVLVLGGGIAGFTYWRVSSQTVYVENSLISAPLVSLSPVSAGVLKALYVQVGDTVTPLEPVALVGDNLVKTRTGGTIVSVQNDIGSVFAAGESVAQMVDPSTLRVVGEVDENKGLSRIRVGDAVVFTVDAFGSEQFKGVVDEISPTSNQSGVVFNISNERQVQKFDVKVRFDTSRYPELKNGMSARMWIYGN